MRHKRDPDHRAALLASTAAISLAAAAASAQIPVDRTLVPLPDARPIVGSPRDLIALSRIFDQDVRIVALGDSFIGAHERRVFPALLAVWPFERLTALAGGVVSDADLITRPAGNLLPLGIERTVGGDDYQVMPDEGGPFFGLPVRRMSEFDLTLQPSNGAPMTPFSPLERQAPNTRRLLRDVTGGSFINAQTTLAYRGLYWLAPDPARTIVSAGVRDQDGALRLFVRPRSIARAYPSQAAAAVSTPTPGQINAFHEDLVLGPADRAEANVVLGPDRAEIDGPNGRYLHLAGSVWYEVDPDTGARVPGLYYSYLGDGSFSYSGFGSDTSSTPDFPKQFTAEQLSHWLSATTIDPEQPLVMFYFMSAERHRIDDQRQIFRSVLDQSDAAAAAAGLPAPLHVLVIPSLHDTRHPAPDTTTWDRNRLAANELAEQRDRVVTISLYDHTYGLLFTENPDARAWLRTNGYDSFRFGSSSYNLTADPYRGRLLDELDLHTLDGPASGAFAHMLQRMIQRPTCWVDYTFDGAVDEQDRAAFEALLAAADPAADLDLSGAADPFDRVTFDELYDQGCMPPQPTIEYTDVVEPAPDDDLRLVCELDRNRTGAIDIFDIVQYFSDFADGKPSADLNNSGEINLFDTMRFFEVIGLQCPLCRTDLDASRSNDLFDIITFFGLFADQDPSAEWDGDGVHSVFDILLFFSDYADCPY